MSDHRCDVNTIDYSQVEAGLLECECGRVWQLHVSVDQVGRKWPRWVATPCPGCRARPCRCRSRARLSKRPAGQGDDRETYSPVVEEAQEKARRRLSSWEEGT